MTNFPPMITSGTILQNRYEIIALLGQGGFGAVYEARDLRLDKRVAVKETFHRDEGMLRRFEREAKILSQLKHPTLPAVTDYFAEEQRYYLVMEYVPGENLDQYLSRFPGERLSEAEAVKIITPILDALEYLHTRTPPIIHRDIKLGNIRITADRCVYLVDFGLAKLFEEESSHDTTQVMISQYYSPPEQFFGKADTRSDLYSLGATLYRMLGGEKPMDARHRKQGQDLVLLQSRTPGVSQHMVRVINRLLAMDPNKRYQSVAQLRRDLHSSMMPAPSVPAWQSAVARLPRRWLAIGLVAVTLLGLLLVGIWQFRPNRPTVSTIAPAEMVVDAFPANITVRGTNLAEVSDARLVSDAQPDIPLDIQSAQESMLALHLPDMAELELPQETTAYTLQLNGRVQETAAITFTVLKIVQGVQPEYVYNELVRFDAETRQAQTGIREEPDTAAAEVAPLTNDSEVEIVDADIEDWYQVRFPDSNNATGWVTRWLVDNQNVPSRPAVCNSIRESLNGKISPGNCFRLSGVEALKFEIVGIDGVESETFENVLITPRGNIQPLGSSTGKGFIALTNVLSLSPTGLWTLEMKGDQHVATIYFYVLPEAEGGSVQR